jgi:hypothetical protein
MKSTKGFTIVDLMFGIVIIGFLAAVMIPAIVGNMDSPERAACEARGGKWIIGRGPAWPTSRRRGNGCYKQLTLSP